MKALMLFFSLCVVAALSPFRSTSALRTNPADTFPGWASAPLPADLMPISFSACEARFAADFPGRVHAYTDGRRTYIVRWVRTPTRKLHPAADCLRALGYTIKHAPIFVATNGLRWGTLNARRGAENLLVRERIADAHHQAWTDISAWFWSATLGRSQGPWWAITVFESAEPRPIKAPL